MARLATQMIMLVIKSVNWNLVALHLRWIISIIVFYTGTVLTQKGMVMPTFGVTSCRIVSFAAFGVTL